MPAATLIVLSIISLGVMVFSAGMSYKCSVSQGRRIDRLISINQRQLQEHHPGDSLSSSIGERSDDEDENRLHDVDLSSEPGSPYTGEETDSHTQQRLCLSGGSLRKRREGCF